jgi:hypothetical protein
VQLDRIPLRIAGENSGTVETHVGVEHGGATGASIAPFAVPPRRLDVRHLVIVLAVAASLLGQGERTRVDPRFVSPSSTLTSYWEALRVNDADAAAECLSAGEHEIPFPGMLWFLPPTEELSLEEFRSLPVASGRVMVTYVVRYRPKGGPLEQRFVFGNELVRTRGEWHIARPLGEASMPEWHSTSGPVDS